jgi:hypothetical protein
MRIVTVVPSPSSLRVVRLSSKARLARHHYWLRERFEVLRPMAEAEQGLTLDFADEPVAELQLH